MAYVSEEETNPNEILAGVDMYGNVLSNTVFVGEPIPQQCVIAAVNNMVIISWDQCVGVVDPQLTGVWGTYCWKSNRIGDAIVQTSQSGTVFVLHTNPLMTGGVGTFLTALSPTTNMSVVWETENLDSVFFSTVNATMVVTDNRFPFAYVVDFTYSSLYQINGVTGEIVWKQSIQDSTPGIVPSRVIAIQNATSTVANSTFICVLLSGSPQLWTVRCVTDEALTVLYFDAETVKQNFGLIQTIFACNGLLIVQTYSDLFGVNVTSGQIIFQQSLASGSDLVPPLVPNTPGGDGGPWGTASSMQYAVLTSLAEPWSALSVFSIGPRLGNNSFTTKNSMTH